MISHHVVSFTLAVAGASGLTGCAERALTREDVPLIPRSVVFSDPTRANVQVSPDGAYLSYLAPVDGVLNVWVAPADDPAAGRPVTNDTVRGVGFYRWAYDGVHLLYLQDEGGDENWRMYAVATATGAARDLTPLRAAQARPLAVSPRHPDAIVVGLNDRDPRYHDVYRIDLATGARTLLLRNDRYERVLVDDDFAVRLAGRFVTGGAFEMVRRTPADAWVPFATWELDDSETTFALDFSLDGDTVFMQDSRDRNTAALTAVSLSTGERRVLAEDERADVSRAFIHPTDKRPQAAAFTYDRVRWQVLDSGIEPEWEYLRTVAAGDMAVVSRTLDDRRWIVSYENDVHAERFYLYDRDARSARFLFTHREDLAGLDLTSMHAVFIPTGDGLTLVSYLSLPPWSDADGDARPDRPVPMVLVPHGGPWFRDTWGLNGIHQWLANRGYAVLAVNFRGSTGFGKEFINASTGEWAGKMHDDLLDAVAWAVAQRITHPDSVAIMGGSYGGYATLVGMTFTPDVFACGVDIVGPSNLVTLLESFPPYWGPRLERWVARIGGDHRTAEGREYLLGRSPISRADSIRRPLLIGQGANDPRVNQAESDQLVAAMEARGIPVTYVLYPDEGHGFGRPENAQSFFAIAEIFLGRCLGGRVEPFGSDFEGSSITVPTGAQHVPGLREALGLR